MDNNLDNKLDYETQKTLEQIRSLGSNMKINVTSPAYKINFDNPRNEQLAGMYMIITDIDYKSDADVSDLNDNTVIMINASHKISLFHTLYGVLYGLISKNIIDNDYVIRFIINIIKLFDGPVIYNDLCSDIDIKLEKLYSNIPDGLDLAIYKNKLNEIMKYVWFIPYSKLDEYSEKIKSDSEEYNKNERNDKTS